MKSKLIIIGASLALISCASTGIDTRELDDLDISSSAQIRFASGDTGPGTFLNGGPIVSVRKYTDESCTNEKTIAKLRNGPFGGASQDSLNIPLNDFHKNAATEMLIEANKPVTLLFHLENYKGTSVFSCGSIVQTTFQSGKQYELSMDMISGFSSGQCKVDLNEIVSTPTNSTRSFIKSFDNSAEGVSDACIAAFGKHRWF